MSASTTTDVPGPPGRVRPARPAEDESLLAADPLWYKDAVVYELHVRAFHDSDGDGIGDFRGLTRKLDYLRELGVTALWLLPFYPSPLRDDGYDIADYRSVNPAYGTLDDFRTFLDEAHRRGLRVITELVVNHTSDQHPWFQRARRAPRGSEHRNYYVWSDDPEKYAETRIIFKDFEPSNWSWDPVAEQYYWHRFYHHQPDLNFENPAVHEALFDVLDYWLEMGVDGMRLDAVPYLYEREGTNCENLPETHDFLKKLRAHVDARFDDRMLLAEANQWPEDAAEYFGDGDECHMNFHFPVMPRLFMSLRMEDRFPILDIWEQTPEIPDGAQWALFLRNHDELTLEMVTDEERDYMYRVYAEESRARINLGIRRRLAPLLSDNRRKIELLNSLLMALPGTPVLYYGDEIGMGDNIYLGDRNGVRTPMQWSSDRNAGFSRANPQKLFLPVVIDPQHHFESVNVEAQQQNPSSLLWWMRRLIALRKRYRAFGRGEFEWVNPENKRVLAFVRSHEDETILVVANLSRFAQSVHLDLSAYAGMVPVELFGYTPFPRVDENPYPLTLGPHGFYWFSLEREHESAGKRPTPEETGTRSPEELPGLAARGAWDDLFRGRRRERLTEVLGTYVRGRRWFAGRGRTVRSLEIEDRIPVDDAELLLLRLAYLDGGSERYLVPVAFVPEDDAGVLEEHPFAGIARLEGLEEPGYLVDAAALPGFGRSLLEAIGEERRFTGEERDRGPGPGEGGRSTVAGVADGDPATILATDEGELPVARLGGAEQTNTSLLFGDRWILKLFRRPEEGVNLDRELGHRLTGLGFEHTPAVAGALELRRGRGEPSTLAVLQAFVPNQGDAWDWALEAAERSLERTIASGRKGHDLPLPRPDGLATGEAGVPEVVPELLDDAYLDAVRLLGRRTGELHRALATPTDDREMAPEPFSTLYQRSLYQSMRNLVGQTFRSLSSREHRLEGEALALARALMERREEILGRFRRLVDRKVDGRRIRVHGDYHLGQVLFTGKDFVIIDFEGEPARSPTERRLKRSPLRDVAGMMRSFHYAAVTAVAAQRERGVEAIARADDGGSWARFWHRWSADAFVRGYLETVEGTGLLPSDPDARALLLDLFLMEKALYEVGYELSHRPRWLPIPLSGALSLLESGEPVSG